MRLSPVVSLTPALPGSSLDKIGPVTSVSRSYMFKHFINFLLPTLMLALNVRLWPNKRAEEICRNYLVCRRISDIQVKLQQALARFYAATTGSELTVNLTKDQIAFRPLGSTDCNTWHTCHLGIYYSGEPRIAPKPPFSKRHWNYTQRLKSDSRYPTSSL